MMNLTIKFFLKVILLILVLVISYFISMMIFLSIFGTGGQGSQAINNGFWLIIFLVPMLITTFLGYKLFKKKKV